jgi:hypothetical protein
MSLAWYSVCTLLLLLASAIFPNSACNMLENLWCDIGLCMIRTKYYWVPNPLPSHVVAEFFAGWWEWTTIVVLDIQFCIPIPIIGNTKDIEEAHIHLKMDLRWMIWNQFLLRFTTRVSTWLVFSFHLHKDIQANIFDWQMSNCTVDFVFSVSAFCKGRLPSNIHKGQIWE